mgnify:CR=1 FL=1
MQIEIKKITTLKELEQKQTFFFFGKEYKTELDVDDNILEIDEVGTNYSYKVELVCDDESNIIDYNLCSPEIWCNLSMCLDELRELVDEYSAKEKEVQGFLQNIFNHKTFY